MKKMEKGKLKVCVLFGGRSTEHEVSLRSASNIVKGLRPDRYEVVLVGIDKGGNWHLNTGAGLMRDGVLAIADAGVTDLLLTSIKGQPTLVSRSDANFLQPIDVVFPALHGSYGEDGTMQGLLRMMNVAFVGPDVMAAAIAMDKAITKQLLGLQGIPVADGYVLTRWGAVPSYEEVTARLGTPIFVKPANAGSSVGVSKVKDGASFAEKIAHAFEFDHKVLIEEAIIGKELECSVMGNESPVAAAVIGEIVPQADFYSYEAKYIQADGALLVIPARVSDDICEQVRALSIKAFRSLGLEGLSRVDFLYGADGKLVINEINTLPGFTNISMYPQLWAASGVSQMDLIDKLIGFALERHERNSKLKISL